MAREDGSGVTHSHSLQPNEPIDTTVEWPMGVVFRIFIYSFKFQVWFFVRVLVRADAIL